MRLRQKLRIKEEKKLTCYFWACDYKENTGEGRLARLYSDIILRKNNIKLKRIALPNSRILNLRYFSPLMGIFYSWKCYFKNKKFIYLNYLPLWNILIFLFLAPKSSIGPITGGANFNKSNLIRRFIFPILYLISQIIILFRFNDIIFSTNLLKKNLIQTVKKKSRFNFVLNALKKNKKKKKNIDFLIYFRKHSNKKTFFPLNFIKKLVHLNLKIYIVGDKLNTEGVKNLGRISHKNLQNLLSKSRYSIASGENILSFFTLDCINNNVKIILNTNQNINIKNINNNFIKLNFKSNLIANKLKSF